MHEGRHTKDRENHHTKEEEHSNVEKCRNRHHERDHETTDSASRLDHAKDTEYSEHSNNAQQRWRDEKLEQIFQNQSNGRQHDYDEVEDVKWVPEIVGAQTNYLHDTF